MSGAELWVHGPIVDDVEAVVAWGDWCLVRYNDEGRFCGPLSLMTTDRDARFALGFPVGRIGLLKLFASAHEAAQCVEPPVGKWKDRPAALADLHFSVSELSYWNRQTRTIYDGGDYRRALVCWLLKLGMYTLRAGQEGPWRCEVYIDCRPR